ncbi:TPA: hypothetical protein UOA81_000876 [Stenotrophomonas maltophilia]|nr:hypothetical protein [Stenotrophomonas maltophilia]
MDDTMISRRDALVLLVIGVGFGVLSAWALFYEWGSSPTSKPVDMAAWTQAIGSLVGIALALYVPWRQRRNQINDERAKAAREEQREEELLRLMHVALWRPVASYHSSCEYLLKKIDKAYEVRVSLPEMIFDRPPEFDQFRDRLHFMGPVGHRINSLIVHQEMIRLMYRDFQRIHVLSMPFRNSLKTRLETGMEMTREISEILLLHEAARE